MIKYIIFDLDGTLYESPEVYQKFAEAAYHTYAQVNCVPEETARRRLEERREELKRQKGFAVPYTLALISYGIDIETWHRMNAEFFNPADFLKPDEALRSSLLEMKKKLRLAVLTNNNDVQTRRILEAIGLTGIFDHVFTFNSFHLLKPDPAILKNVLAVMKAQPEECLMVGDRYEVDLIPARNLGMQTSEVKGPAGVVEIGRRFESSLYPGIKNQ